MEIAHLVAMANLHRLSENPYPGRGIVIGCDKTGQFLIQVYWIMGRSANSRNRVFNSDNTGRVFTEAANPAEMTDPSLVIYNAMASLNGCHIVSNGSQTDDVVKGIGMFGVRGGSFHCSMSSQQYEPDKPNFTPRITGQCVIDGSTPLVQLSTLRKSLFGNGCERHLYSYPDIAPGFGYCITTYKGDGDPLPSWQGEPLLMPLAGSINEIADTYCGILNEENFVSLAVKFIPIDGRKSDIYIVNKYKKG